MAARPQQAVHYNLGPVKSWVESAAYYLGPKYGITSIGGWRATDPFPDHPSGHALDFMVSDRTRGDALAADAIANARQLGVKYIIWQRQVWTADRGWHPYTSTGNPHTDHVHVTFNDQPGSGVPTGPAGASFALPGIGELPIPTPGNVTEALSNLGNAMFGIAGSLARVGELAGLVTRAFLPSNLIRGFALFLGTIFILVGIWFLASEVKESSS